MLDSETLRTMAELGIALAGFSGIVAVLGRRLQGEWSSLDRARLLGLLIPSFGVVFFSLLPEVIQGARAPGLWLRIAHALLAAYQVGGMLFVLIRAGPALFARRADRVVALLLLGLGIVLILAQCGVALGFFESFAVPLYVAALVNLLLVSSMNFVFLLFASEERAA